MTVEKARRIFVSYSRVNKEFVLGLAKELKKSGFPIWLDQLDIPTGARWDEELEKALRECEMFMVILSPNSIASENVKDEIGYAIEHGKRILPILFEKCDIPLRLRRFQYVDFTRLSHTEGVGQAKILLTDLMAEKSMLIPEQKDTVSTTRDEASLLNFFDQVGSQPGNQLELIHVGDKLYSNRSRKIYVSYSRDNEKIVAGLAEELKRSRLPIWLDQFDVPPGVRKDEEVEKALRECGALMVILNSSGDLI